MSSISASGSDSSDFSGSEGSSFSESSASNLSERSGGRRRFNRKIMEKKKDLSQPTEQRFNKKGFFQSFLELLYYYFNSKTINRYNKPQLDENSRTE